jgi:hypothetical protein
MPTRVFRVFAPRNLASGPDRAMDCVSLWRARFWPMNPRSFEDPRMPEPRTVVGGCVRLVNRGLAPGRTVAPSEPSMVQCTLVGSTSAPTACRHRVRWDV